MANCEVLERELTVERAREAVKAEGRKLGVMAGHADHCHVRIVPSGYVKAKARLQGLERASGACSYSLKGFYKLKCL